MNPEYILIAFDPTEEENIEEIVAIGVYKIRFTERVYVIRDAYRLWDNCKSKMKIKKGKLAIFIYPIKHVDKRGFFNAGWGMYAYSRYQIGDLWI